MPNVIQCNFSIFNIEVSGKILKFSACRDSIDQHSFSQEAFIFISNPVEDR